MIPAQQPSQPNPSDGTANSTRSRQRSTIGFNPLDQPRPRFAAEDSAAATSARASRSELSGGGRHVFAAWAAATQSILDALFETQYAVLRAFQAGLQAASVPPAEDE